MRRLTCIAVFIFVMVCVVIIGFRVENTSAMEELQKGISKEVIRFHVRANSDSESDQTLKLKVKDSVVNYIRPMLDESESLSRSCEILDRESENIKKVANSVIQDEGYDYPVNVYFEDSYFPVKSYGDVTFPPGEYRAFRVDIGDAKGKNWWCVLYPPLCFVDTTYGILPDEGKEKLSKALSEEEYKCVTDSNNTQYRFKYLKFLNWIFE